MRHSLLLGSALRANSFQFPRTSTQLLRAPGSDLSLPRIRQPSRRPYATASPEPQHEPPTPTTATHIIQTPDVSLAALAINPPSTTRPPPLNLPAAPPASTPRLSKPNLKYLFSLGMAYVKFYKAGLSQIVTNTRLLYSSRAPSSTPSPATAATATRDLSAPQRPPPPGTRAHRLLRERWAYDVRRLPLFALVLLVCGEFTPLVVLAFPRAVPLTCRVPRQAEGLLRREEAARALARREPAVGAVAGGRPMVPPPARAVAQILGLRAGRWTPDAVLRRRVDRRVRFLDADDALLVRAGGAKALVEDEVRLACRDRGIGVLGRGEQELRDSLGRWLRLTDERVLGREGRARAVLRLLCLEEKHWEEGAASRLR